MSERSIFLAALEIDDPAQRADYVAKACGDDTSLQSQIEGLLQAHRQPRGFMERPAPALVSTIEDRPTIETTGASIGPYKLLERIGEGGFGVVFLAEQLEPVRRRVALKVLKPGMDTAQVVARFEAERQALAIMDHPNIARVFDGGVTTTGRPYFVMELVKGIPITEFCDENHLTPRQRLELFISVCQAVQHAHQKGIIHRDIKPSNVLVTRNEKTPIVKVIDFGVAKALGQELTDKTLFTGIAQMIGTPLYMSPEQAGVSNFDVDTRSDIYSLGVLLYELLTGMTPFAKFRLSEASYDEIRRIIREEEPPKPSTRIAQSTESLHSIGERRRTEPAKLTKIVRGDLDWIVMKAMEKDRSRRYETASALATDVQRYLADEPVLACPPSFGYRMQKFVRRNKRALATTGVLAFALLVATGAVVVSAFWAAEQAKARFKLESEAKKELEFNLYLRNIPLAQVEASNLNWSGVENLLKDCPEHLRGWEFNYLKRLPNAQLAHVTAPVTGGISANLDLAFSPDGQLVAGPGPNNSVTVWNLMNGDQSSLKGSSDPADRARVLCAAFHPTNGRLLVSASSDGTLRFWNPETGRAVHDSVKRHEGEIVGMTFNPTGQLLATIGADEKVKLWDVDKKESYFEFPTVYRDQARMLRRPAFSPDGRLFAYGEGNTVKVWDVTTRQLVHSLEGHEDLVPSVAFSAQGDRLLSVSWDLTAKVWDLASGEVLFPIHGHGSAAWAVEFSPDGNLVAAAGSVADPTIKIYNARTGELVHSLVGHATRVGCVAFHPDGKRLVSCSIDQTIRIWELDRGKEVLTLRGHAGLITRVLFDPKGWWLASSSDDGKLRVWDGTPPDQAPRRACVNFDGHTRQVFSLKFRPDGQQLASASQDKTLRVWNVVTAQTVHLLEGHTDTVFAVAFGRDGLLASGSYDRTMKVWDSRTGRLVQTLEGPETRARGLALSSDEKMIASTSITPPFQMWRWDVRKHASGPRLEQRSPPLARHNGPAFVLAFSPDNKLVASAGTDGMVLLWNAKTGEREITLLRTRSGDRSWSVAFHPLDRGRLAAGYSENRVMIWDFADPASSKEPKAILPGQRNAADGTAYGTGHTGDVYNVSYSSDGRWLASASWHEVIIWDTTTYKEVYRIGGFRGLIWSVAWSPGRLLLAIGGGHKDIGTIELWDLSDLPAKAGERGANQ